MRLQVDYLRKFHQILLLRRLLVRQCNFHIRQFQQQSLAKLFLYLEHLLAQISVDLKSQSDVHPLLKYRERFHQLQLLHLDMAQ